MKAIHLPSESKNFLLVHTANGQWHFSLDVYAVRIRVTFLEGAKRYEVGTIDNSRAAACRCENCHCSEQWAYVTESEFR